MHLTDHASIGRASKIPSSKMQPVISFSPVVLPFTDRSHDLQIRVTLPLTGDNLPIIILSHGHGPYLHLSSLEGYAPIVEYWAACGFVIIQPTHLTSTTIYPTIEPEMGKELVMTSRVKDISRIIDSLDSIEETVPLLKGRVNRAQIGLAGHSAGGFTAEMILGAVNTDPRDGSKLDAFDGRVKAGIIIGGTGAAADFSESARKGMSYRNTDYSTMRTPTLVVWGDRDVSPHLTTRGADWHNDPYTLAPGPKSSLKVTDCHHAFGGISGWDCSYVEGDGGVELLSFVQRMTGAYFRTQLYGDQSWENATLTLKDLPELGIVEEKV